MSVRTRDELAAARKAAIRDLQATEWGAQLPEATIVVLAERQVAYNLARSQLERLLIGFGVTQFMNLSVDEVQMICFITGAPVELGMVRDDIPF